MLLNTITIKVATKEGPHYQIYHLLKSSSKPFVVPFPPSFISWLSFFQHVNNNTQLPNYPTLPRRRKEIGKKQGEKQT